MGALIQFPARPATPKPQGDPCVVRRLCQTYNAFVEGKKAGVVQIFWRAKGMIEVRGADLAQEDFDEICAGGDNPTVIDCGALVLVAAR